MLAKSNLFVFDSSDLAEDSLELSNIKCMIIYPDLYTRHLMTGESSKLTVGLKKKEGLTEFFDLDKPTLENIDFNHNTFVVGDIKELKASWKKINKLIPSSKKIIIVENCTVNFDKSLEDLFKKDPRVIINRI